MLTKHEVQSLRNETEANAKMKHDFYAHNNLKKKY